MRLTSSRILLVVVLLVVISTRSALQTGGSTLAHTMTAHGNAQIDTGQSKLGGASGLFSGNGAYLSTPDSADWYFGTGDFTIDFWVRFNALPAGTVYMWIGGQINAAQNDFDAVNVYNSAGTYYWVYSFTPAGNQFFASPGLATGIWYHVAIVRSGSSFMVFQSGTQCGSTYTSGSAVPDVVGTWDIGGSSAIGRWFNGWLDEYRISKGVARWTSNFTPSSSAYSADAYTVLLLHMDGTSGSKTFLDDSLFTAPDFSMIASPTSQSVAAGSTATYTLSLSASNGYSGTVALTVTSGCPTDAICLISPDSVSSFPGAATLSVQTAITSGSGTITVTATDGSSPPITHTVTVSLTVVGPASFNFNVKAGATQIVVTLTYSWSGSGAPPQGSITLAGPGANPTLQESGAVVYDRTSIAVSGGSNTYMLLHRVTFTITAPSSAQVWTALVSLSGVSTYNVTIEVS